MKKLSKDELLKHVDDWIESLEELHRNQNDESIIAMKQIKSLIENQPSFNKSKMKHAEDLGLSFSAYKIVFDRGYAEGKEDYQPGVTMEFVNIWAMKCFYKYYDTGTPVSFVLDLLAEAGVKIKEK